MWGLALEVVLDKIAKDAQERLIYSAQKVKREATGKSPRRVHGLKALVVAFLMVCQVMRVEIEMFRPTPADLDYPRKLEDYYALTKTHHRYHPHSPSRHTAACLSF